MNFYWILSIVLAIVVAIVAGDATCPAGFEKENKLCTVKRAIHGECPPNTRLNIDINKCVYVH